MLFRQLRTRPSWGTPYLKPHRLAVEHLESRIALSVNFVDSGQELAIPDTDSQLSVEAHLGDADGDGDLDAFVLGQDGGPYLVRLWLNDGTGHMRGSDELLHGGDRGDFAIATWMVTAISTLSSQTTACPVVRSVIHNRLFG